MLTFLAGGIALRAQTNGTFQIAGTLTRPDDDCRQAVVVLCDAESGEPLYHRTFQPFTSMLDKTNDESAFDWLMDTADAAGHFQFTNLPAGHYIVVAEALSSESQPSLYQKFRAESIHLLGREAVTVPSEQAQSLRLVPPGTNTIRFDQQFPNDDGFLILSTHPQRGDPVLGWLGWGTNFIRHSIGCNWMPAGRTIVHGLPDEAYASIFANDDSPGFGSIRLPVGATNAVKMPIVAGWSDGYKMPPTNLVWLVELLQTNRFNLNELLGITNRPGASQNFLDRERERARLVSPIWNKEIVLPTGQTTRVADLLAALGYARLSGKFKN